MGNVCNGESHQSQPEIELAPRVAQPQRGPVQAQSVLDIDAAPEASRQENSGAPLKTNTNRHIHHDPTTVSSGQEPRKPCQLYAKGYCKNGETCTFLHENPKEADGEERSKDSKKSYDFIRELRGAWVEFGPGATATQITLPSDFSAIRISNLPTGLPESLRDQDVIQVIPKRYRPFQIQIQYLVYTDDKETESTFVRSMLDEYGPLERWEVSEISDGGHIKGQAVFFEESHARNAAAALDGKRLPFSKSRRLFTAVVTMVRFDALSRVYNVVQGQINAYKRSWEDQNIEFVAFPPRGSYLILQLKGSDRESMANAKHELELILAGEVMRQDGKNIWHPSFNNGGEAYETVKTIEEELGIVTIRDGWLSQFRVFGAGGRQALAAEALGQVIKDMVSSHLIRLDQDSELRWAVEGGFKEIQSQLGQGKAVFDESSRSILIQGSKNDFAEAKFIIARGQAGPSSDQLKREQHCQICFWKAEEPVMTSCNHVYCGQCFIEMCEAIARNASEFCIVCEGNSGRCRRVLELSEICSFLPSNTFDNILEESFTSFVQRHQQQFRYCPTPDCSQVYRAASQTEEVPPTFTCNKCLSFICTACHAAHPSLTCTEHRDHTSGGLQALNKLKKELGVQDCPRCETSLEKIAGCDHITCQACRTHICWVCMATFRDGDACYQHLMAVHKGGEYD
ncbi:hypothetical protein NW759_013042 [Fusarium solani]|nr:hypothetical protein NW759_013042 [Fusarium solani]